LNSAVRTVISGSPQAKEGLKNPAFVVPAKAGTQRIQMRLDARLRGHDD
jgi:hypothetical protein